MFSFGSKSQLVNVASAAVLSTLSGFESGFSKIPNSAYRDPYVLGYLNAIIFSVALKSESELTEFAQWDILAKVYKRIVPEIALECYQLTRNAVAKGNSKYFSGERNGSICANVLYEGVTSNSPPSVFTALEEAEVFTSERPVPLTAVSGALIRKDLFQYIKDHHFQSAKSLETKSENHKLTPEQLHKTKKTGVLYAELDAVVNMNAKIAKHRENAALAGKKETENEKAFAKKWAKELERVQRKIAIDNIVQKQLQRETRTRKQGNETSKTIANKRSPQQPQIGKYPAHKWGKSQATKHERAIIGQLKPHMAIIGFSLFVVVFAIMTNSGSLGRYIGAVIAMTFQWQVIIPALVIGFLFRNYGSFVIASAITGVLAAIPMQNWGAWFIPHLFAFALIAHLANATRVILNKD